MTLLSIDPQRELTSPPAHTPPEPVAFNYAQSDSFASLLRQCGISLLVTTYQANKLLVIREQQGGLSILVRSFERPMGLAVDPRRISLGTRDQVWTFRNAPDLAPQVEPVGVHDACFIPRRRTMCSLFKCITLPWTAQTFPSTRGSLSVKSCRAASKTVIPMACGRSGSTLMSTTPRPSSFSPALLMRSTSPPT